MWSLLLKQYSVSQLRYSQGCKPYLRLFKMMMRGGAACCKTRSCDKKVTSAPPLAKVDDGNPGRNTEKAVSKSEFSLNSGD